MQEDQSQPSREDSENIPQDKTTSTDETNQPSNESSQRQEETTQPADEQGLTVSEVTQPTDEPNATVKEASSTSEEDRPAQPKTIPAWMQAEIASKPSSEIERIQEQMNRLERQLALERNRVRSLEYAQHSSPNERGGCLTAWLIFMGIGSALIAIVAFTVMSISPVLGLFLIATVAATVAGIIGTWQLKKWGYYTLMTIYGLGLVFAMIDLCTASSHPGRTASSNIGSIIGTLIGTCILYLLVKDRWELFE